MIKIAHSEIDDGSQYKVLTSTGELFMHRDPNSSGSISALESNVIDSSASLSEKAERIVEKYFRLPCPP